MRHALRTARRPLVIIVLLGCWSLATGAPEGRADVILDTLPPLNSNDGPFPGIQVGQAVQLGGLPIALTSVVYTEAFSVGPMPGESFAVFSRNAEGMVGSPSFT